MTATKTPGRIAAGWYYAADQLTLSLWRGQEFERVKVGSRIVPKRCRFKVPQAPGRDVWYTIESYGSTGHFQRVT